MIKSSHTIERTWGLRLANCGRNRSRLVLLLQLLSRLAAGTCLTLVVGIFTGCATPSADHPVASTPPPITGKVLTEADLRTVIPGAIAAEKQYAEVNSAWLPVWYRIYRSKLSKIGLVRWDERFDCNRFADCYTNLAQAHFAVKMFHSDTPAQALAIGPIWYRRSDGTGAHAIVQAWTERGRVFIEPQTGQELDLDQSELQTVFMQIF